MPGTGCELEDFFLLASFDLWPGPCFLEAISSS